MVDIVLQTDVHPQSIQASQCVDACCTVSDCLPIEPADVIVISPPCYEISTLLHHLHHDQNAYGTLSTYSGSPSS